MTLPLHNNLPWYEIAGNCCGVEVNIGCNEARLAAALRSDLAHLIPTTEFAEIGRPRCIYSVIVQNSVFAVRRKGRRLGSFLSRKEAIRCLRSDIQFSIAERSKSPIFIHAGVVSWQGRAIILPGRSCSGKTTLVRELLRRGATYYSDEYAVVRLDGRILPFPSPLNIRCGNGRFGNAYSPDRLGAVTGKEPASAGLIIFTQYRPSVSWKAQRVSDGEAAVRLLANTVAARTFPSDALRAVRNLVLASPAFRGCRGEAALAADAILMHLSATSQRHT